MENLTHNGQDPRSKNASRVYVRASEDDRRVFEAVAGALGVGAVPATLRYLVYEKARELALDVASAPKKKTAPRR